MFESLTRPRSWQTATEQASRWRFPLIAFEWCFEWINYWLSRLAFFQFLEHATRFSVLVAVVVYFQSRGEQRKQKHYEGWQVINAAHGKKVAGGRGDALRDLVRDRVSLAGIDLSNTFLADLHLDGAQMPLARLDSAMFERTSITNSSLVLASLRDALLPCIDFSNSDLNRADFRGALLVGASLKGTSLMDAHLDSAKLVEADLRDLADWHDIKSMKNANLYGVLNPPAGFLAWAVDTMGAILENPGFEGSYWLCQRGGLH